MADGAEAAAAVLDEVDDEDDAGDDAGDDDAAAPAADEDGGDGDGEDGEDEDGDEGDDDDVDGSEDGSEDGFAAALAAHSKHSKGATKKRPLKAAKGEPKKKKAKADKPTKDGEDDDEGPKKAAGLSKYFDDMAHEDSDDDDGEFDEAQQERNRKLREKQTEEEREFDAELQRQDKRREREGQFQAEDADVGGVVKALEERYQRARTPGDLRRELGGDGEEGGAVGDRGSIIYDAARQAQAPALSDPRLWVVPCKIGSEKEGALALMNKAIAMARKGEPLQISAVLCTGLKGFIYVESRTEPAARAAVQGLRLLRGWSMKMVPVTDMVSVVSTQAKKKKGAGTDGRLRVGDWARISRDKYRGDLARIVAVGEGGTSAVVQLVPRVDASAPAGAKGTVRPAPRLFSAAEVTAAGGEVVLKRFKVSVARDGSAGAARDWSLADASFEFFEGFHYRRGFLYREVTTATMLKREAAVPSLDELQRFVTPPDDAADDDDDDDDDAAKRRKEASAVTEKSLLAQIEDLAKGAGGSTAVSAYSRGDRVQCLEGDLRNLYFIVKFVEEKDGAAVVHCEGDAVSGVVQIEASRLVKAITVGARVAVSDGQYAGQTGVVLEQGNLKGELVAVILTDLGGREIAVLLAHCHETSAVARGLDTLEGFELHDIVQLPLGAVGVVSHVGADDLEVLTARGAAQRVRPAEVSRKLNAESMRNVSLDARDEHVRAGDVVVCDAGDRKGVEATVVRAYRAVLWLQETATAGGLGRPSGGLFCSKARGVRVAGQRALAGGLADSYMGLGRPRMVNEEQFNGAGGDQKGAMARAHSQKDVLVGRAVRICKGNYKGLMGIVANATATHVTIELHTRNRKATLSRDLIKLVEGAAGGEALHVAPRGAAGGGPGEAMTPFLAGATPLPYAGQTPLYGAQTPAAGAMTPAYGAATPGRGTPAHTPAYGGSATPGRETPYRTQGTPAHQGAQTPIHDGSASVWLPQARAAVPETYALRPGAPAAPAGRSDAASAAAGAWCVPGACALLEDGECRVEAVRGGAVDVTLRKTKERRTVPPSALQRLDPSPKDVVRVVDNETTYDAELLSIEDHDGIIKLDNGEYKIIDFAAIAKLATW
ncbi:hypothetical protein M885DRAFT_511446 [Pelagophyceae sp. CCMP2097]|nr:hypothetical protein M885DRAFT_511446 [Pelagophyceae sp. CCMP2097]